MTVHQANRRFSPDSRRAIRSFPLITLVTIGIALVAAYPVTAQQAKPGNPSPLSSYVPDGVVFYAEFDNLYKTEEQLSGTDLWEFVRQFTAQGSDAEWRTLLTQELGLDTNRTLDILSRTRFAVAVREWGQLDESVIIVQRPNGFSVSNTLSLFVGNDIRRKWRKGRVQMAETSSGLLVAVGQQVVVASPTAKTDSLMDRIVARLNNREINSLWRHPPFREQVMRLPRSRQALAYWNQRRPQDAGEESTNQWLSAFDMGVLGLYVRDGRTEIVARDAVVRDQEYVYTPRVRPRSLEMLPQSTLAAWATTIKPDEIWDSLKEQPPHEIVAQLMRAIQSRIEPESFRSDVLNRVGPRMITVLGCEFATDERRPLVGVLLECVDPDDVAASLGAMVGRDAESENGRTLAVRRTNHLGATIYELELARQARDTVDSIAQLISDDLRPAFAVMDGWLVASTSPQHVRQILDAARGLTPSISDVVNLGVERDRIRRSVGVVVVQPAFAVNTLRYWRELLSQSPSHESPSDPDEMLGIEIVSPSTNGQIVIASVDSNGASDGTLYDGDAVLGCNGRVFDLSDTIRHFGQLLNQRDEGGRVSLRLLRDGQMMDVVLNLDLPELPGNVWTGSDEVDLVLGALDPIEGLASRLSLAVYASIKPPRTAASSEFAFHFLDAREQDDPKEEHEEGEPIQTTTD